MPRLFLSPPDVGDDERASILDAFDSNWIAPLGPHVDAFEEEFATFTGMPSAAALSSGTAALHLALLLIGVGPGDDVIVPTLTFVATANAVAYVGARPVFVDSELTTWNLDPELLEEELRERARMGRLPAAVLTVDLYGQCADYDAVLDSCARFEVPVIEDAAEAMGATYRDRAAGSFGRLGVFSFNGNKIMTTSGGGMLVAHDPELTRRARFLGSQARDDALHYEHSETGYNYRISNLLAALGRAQLRGLPARIERRREINRRYRDLLGSTPGIGFMPDDPRGRPTNWLTVATVDAEAFGATSGEICAHLDTLDIEARPAWKPMHCQPLFRDAPIRGGAVAEAVFRTGVCLPSGSAMTDADVDRVASGLLEAAGR